MSDAQDRREDALHDNTGNTEPRNTESGNTEPGNTGENTAYPRIPVENTDPEAAHSSAQHSDAGDPPQPPRSDAGRPIGAPTEPATSESTAPESAAPESAASDPVTPEPQAPNTAPNAGQNTGPTPMQRTSQAAREQAGAAADAFRRGEFMQDSALDGSANNDDRLIALLSYVTQVFIPLVMPIIVLLSESSKQRPFQRYHAVQSLALTLLFVLVAIAATLGGLIIQIIPLVGQLVSLLLFCLSPIAYLMAVISMFYYGYQAYQGKRFAVPGLTTFLRDQGWMD